MPERVDDKVSISKRAATMWIFALAAVIFAISGFVWWRSVYMSSTNVFWGMIENNLATSSITKNIVQKSEQQSLNQYLQVSFGQTNAAHGLISINQNQGDVKTSVKTETIGTTTTDYNRYLDINTGASKDGKKVDTSTVEGVWAKADKSAGQDSAQYFRQSILGIVPTANLGYKDRQETIKLIKDKKVYDFSSGSIKSQKVDGKDAYVYEVSINATAYIEIMQKVTKLMGVGDMGLDASQYAGSPAVKAEFTIGKLSRQLMRVKYSSTGQEETYNGQGIEVTINEPTKTISLSELQERIQKVLQ